MEPAEPLGGAAELLEGCVCLSSCLSECVSSSACLSVCLSVCRSAGLSGGRCLSVCLSGCGCVMMEGVAVCLGRMWGEALDGLETE